MPFASNNYPLRAFFAVVIPMWMFACDKTPPVPPISEDLLPMSIEVPAHFREIEVPANNPLTPAKVALGKRLFYDPILSNDLSISCGSCHLPDKGFSDPRRFSVGHDGLKGTRQSMAIMNLAYARNLFWDGRATSLEEQVIDPILSHFEMASDTATVMARLESDPYYAEEFKRVFATTTLSFDQVEKVIASFERTLVSANSRYDQFIASGFDSTIFTPSELRGYKLYFTEDINTKHAECFHCHGGFNMDEPSGAFLNNALDEFYDDLGRGAVTKNNRDINKFRVPSLRNIEYTAPYMHDGRFQTLEEVLDHYGKGGEATQINRDPLIQNISLTEEEKADVIAFLKTLSDPTFINNPAHRP